MLEIDKSITQIPIVKKQNYLSTNHDFIHWETIFGSKIFPVEH